MELNLNTIYEGDALKVLKRFPDRSVHTIVTSPPYWALRNYGVAGQMGLEESPRKYIVAMVRVFRECRRVLCDDGTLWLNIGDTYYGGKGTNGASIAYEGAENRINGKALVATAPGEIRPNDRPQKGLKPKDMVGIPWRLAFALQNDGWYLRQDIIWSKPNPMPESVTDRCTKSHEYIFLLSKDRKYYFDSCAIKTDIKQTSTQRLLQDVENQKGSFRVPGKTNGAMKAVGSNKANKRSVWSVPTEPFFDAHFAVYPQQLISDCILAGCPPDGVVLDPFYGTGTTGIVARKLGRNFVGIELNPSYIAIANKRLKKELGLFM